MGHKKVSTLLTSAFLHESFDRTIKDHHSCVISGPSFALEVANDKPTALSVASNDKETREYWAKVLRTKTLRAYTNDDVIGVEVGGTVKNIFGYCCRDIIWTGFWIEYSSSTNYQRFGRND